MLLLIWVVFLCDSDKHLHGQMEISFERKTWYEYEAVTELF